MQRLPRPGQQPGQVGHAAFRPRQGGAAGGEQVGEREDQALVAVVQPLARGAQQAGQVWQAAFGALQAQAAFLHHAVQRAGEPGPLLLQVGGDFHATRHGEFGGSGGGGGAAVGGEVDQGGVGFVADGGDQRDGAGRRRAHHGFVVEGHQVFEAATAAGDDDHVWPRNGAAGLEAGEAFDGFGDTLGGPLALHRHGPEDEVAREAAGQGGLDVLDHRALGGGDDADHGGQQRQGALAGGVEQAFLGQAQAQRLDAGEQGAGAGVFHAVDDELVGGAFAIGADLALGDHFHPVLRHQAEARDGEFPHHTGDLAALILQREVDVAAGIALQLRDLAAHPDAPERAFERAFHSAGNLRDAVLGNV